MASIRSAPRGPFKASRGKPTAKDRATIVILKIINIPKSGSVRKLQTPEKGLGLKNLRYLEIIVRRTLNPCHLCKMNYLTVSPAPNIRKVRVVLVTRS